MGLEHLEGKRTGRPRGSKSTPPWVKAVRWASKNLDNPHAVPPSALAGRLLALGREHPDRLVACLANLYAMEHQDEVPARASPPLPTPPDNSNGAAQALPAPQGPRKLRTVFVSVADLSKQLWHYHTSIPSDARLVGCALDEARPGIVYTISSETFAPIPVGQPIPEMKPRFSNA